MEPLASFSSWGKEGVFSKTVVSWKVKVNHSPTESHTISIILVAQIGLEGCLLMTELGRQEEGGLKKSFGMGR